MRDPIEWFEEAIDSGRYDKEMIEYMRKCLDKEVFDIELFLEWVKKKLDNVDRSNYG
jgi:hypothetical protein